MSNAELQMKSLLRELVASSSVEELGDYVSALHEVKQALESARERGKFFHKEADLVLRKWFTGY